MNVETMHPLQVIRTEKFKTVRIQMRFFEPLDDTTVSARALMLSMLQAKTADHPSRRQFQNHLESLYDTRLNTRPSKLGNTHVGEVSLRFIHPDYTEDKDTYIKNVLQALNATLHRPVFDSALLEEEKRFLKAHFASEYANKDVYASKRYQEHLFRDHPYRVPAIGTPEGVDPVTLEDVRNAYRRMMGNPVFITVVGDVDDALIEIIRTQLDSFNAAVPSDMIIRHGFQFRESVLETMNLSQDRVFMTLRSDVYYTDRDVQAMRVLDTLLGGGSDSLLFDTVREKHGLAYQVYSSYQPFTGLITVMAGVAHENVEKTKSLIRKTVSELQEGAFSDDAFTIAKQSVKQSVKRSYDLQGALGAKALLHKVFNAPIDKDTVLSDLEAVTPDDVIRLAGTLEFVFTYVLGGKTHA